MNQDGVVTANTSTSLNGSIWLHARDGAGRSGDTSPTIATIGGQLDSGQGSTTEILPDTSDTSTSSAGTAFTPSLIDMSANTVRLNEGSLVHAPGGKVTIDTSRVRHTGR